MATQDRRNSMGLEEAYRYWRSIESGEHPSLFKSSSAVRTIELAIAPAQSEWQSSSLSLQAWSTILKNLLHVLLTHFEGYFLVYKEAETFPLPAGSDWPVKGRIEFYPQAFKRRSDCFQISIEEMQPSVLVILRYQFANGEQNLSPEMFETAEDSGSDSHDENAPVFAQYYEICEREAEKGKKRAQRTWYHTLCEARACKSKEQRRELLRRLSYLESVWGCGAAGSA